MRLALVLFALVPVLQGCTVVGLGLAAGARRGERVAATSTGAALAERLPTPGDSLTIWLTDGTLVHDAVASSSPDSLGMAGGTSFALRDIERAERPWSHA